MNIAGLVLAGGKSSRYGTQKLFADYEGAPLVLKSVRALQQAPLSYYIVTNEQLAAYFNKKNPFIIEQTPHEGPLSALYTGLHYVQQHHFTHVQVLAGDLPYIDESFTVFMQQQLNRYPDSDVLLPVHGGLDQPLHGLYSVNCLSTIERLLPDFSSMRALYSTVDTKRINFADDVPYFKNINRITDWRD
ncbi:molybdenum cofactor guanylyltransferase [Shouchella sp. JSM 1781072]|uniref:molybdenum cofactor guanylyltransferase n=1 Tax=Bacillaceae TaxID=186817 RepID=UPI000C06B20E|nr:MULTISPECIES: molybdenum cofactor guanylyltransferase [Bacillaceae]UTR05688.1 molybdenum cofactor guanylyltransferase [Alkalihalobacillus sp. LMS6]